MLGEQMEVAIRLHVKQGPLYVQVEDYLGYHGHHGHHGYHGYHIQVEDYHELFWVLKAFFTGPKPSGN